MKVAVITDVPAPATLNVEPETPMTDVVADEYVNEPAIDPVTVGAVTVNEVSPNDFATLLHVEKVGVALPMMKVSVTCVAAE